MATATLEVLASDSEMATFARRLKQSGAKVEFHRTNHWYDNVLDVAVGILFARSIRRDYSVIVKKERPSSLAPFPSEYTTEALKYSVNVCASSGMSNGVINPHPEIISASYSS